MAKVLKKVVHHQLGFDILPEILDSIDSPMESRIHDYYIICPFINLADEDGIYCGEPVQAGCNACISLRHPEFIDIDSWRIDKSKILFDSKKILTPSHDVARRMAKYFPKQEFNVKSFDIKTHNFPKQSALETGFNNIVVLGELNLNKGLHTLVSTIKNLEDNV